MKRLNSMRLPAQRDQHGQSAVEIALLLPVLLLLIMGIIMASFIFYASIQVSNATREGARAGSVYLLTVGDTGATLDTTVKNAIYYSSTLSALGYLDKSSSNFSVRCTLNGTPCTTYTQNNPPHQGDQIIVTLIYSYTVPVVSVMLPMFPQPIVFSPIVNMEVQ